MHLKAVAFSVAARPLAGQLVVIGGLDLAVRQALLDGGRQRAAATAQIQNRSGIQGNDHFNQTFRSGAGHENPGADGQGQLAKLSLAQHMGQRLARLALLQGGLQRRPGEG